jgi:hypothetical protein
VRWRTLVPIVISHSIVNDDDDRKGLTLAEDEKDADKDELIGHHVILHSLNQTMCVYKQVIQQRTKITVVKPIALVRRPVLITYRMRLFTNVSDLASTCQREGNFN